MDILLLNHHDLLKNPLKGWPRGGPPGYRNPACAARSRCTPTVQLQVRGDGKSSSAKEFTLLGTNISHPKDVKGRWVFPFPIGWDMLNFPGGYRFFQGGWSLQPVVFFKKKPNNCVYHLYPLENWCKRNKHDFLWFFFRVAFRPNFQVQCFGVLGRGKSSPLLFVISDHRNFDEYVSHGR